MQNISTHKIILLVVFISAALITSLFIFHASHKQSNPIIASDAGLIFEAPREIKSFELAMENDTKFTQKNFYGHWTLLFFGFTHCSSICPTTLDLMNHVYTKLRPDYPHLQVVLISLDPDRDTPESIAEYARSFNPDFIGTTGKIQEIRKLQSQLGIFSARDNAESSDYQLQHTSSILLINPQGKWAGLFKFGMQPEEFVKNFKTSVTVLSANYV